MALWAEISFTIALGLLCALPAGCALPSRLGLANLEVDPLEPLTRQDADAAASSYPTSLNNPNRPIAVRPTAPAPPSTPPVQPATPPLSQPVPPPLPLQQANSPVPIPLNPQELAGRLPVRIGNETPGPEAKVEKQAPREEKVREPAPIVLAPTSTDVSGMLASKEFTWPALALKAAESTPPSPTSPAVPKPEAPKALDVSVPQPKPAWPPEPAPTESSEILLPKLIAAVEKEIRDRTARKEEDALPALEQKLRLLQLVADRSDDAVEKIDQLPPAEREAFKQLMFALSTWLSPDEAKRSSLRNAKVLRSLHEVDSQLSAVSKLDLKNPVFCEKVESFGWYTEFPRAEFSPKQQVILYAEVRNFAAEAKTATSFETELQGSYQIFDAAGNIVDERQLPLDREICRNFRRDYFLAYRIYLPSEIAPGRYRLELTLEDLKAKKDFKGRKQGEAMIEFAIK